MNGKGQARIFFYFQKQQRELENGTIQEHGFPEFFVTDGKLSFVLPPNLLTRFE